MLKYVPGIILVFLLATIGFAWLDTDSPEGHIESTTHNPDGKIIYAPRVRGGFAIHRATYGVLKQLYGTAHKGGADLAAANAKGIVYTPYIWRDIDRDGTADADDEPSGSSTLNGAITAAATTITLADASGFPSTGFIKIDSELIKYKSRTATAITIADDDDARGYNETSAAIHSNGATVTAVQAWERLPTPGGVGLTVACDGSPYNVIGWDASGTGDDGTEANLMQAAVHYFSFVYGRRYLLKLRVVDGSGNTNTEVGGTDILISYGTTCYTTVNGDVAQGLEDDEVVDISFIQPRRLGIF